MWGGTGQARWRTRRTPGSHSGKGWLGLFPDGDPPRQRQARPGAAYPMRYAPFPPPRSQTAPGPSILHPKQRPAPPFCTPKRSRPLHFARQTPLRPPRCRFLILLRRLRAKSYSKKAPVLLFFRLFIFFRKSVTSTKHAQA